MNKNYKLVENIDEVDGEMQDIMVELENLMSQKYDLMDYRQRMINSEAFLRFFDRIMVQIKE